jgi:hypothetical protein
LHVTLVLGGLDNGQGHSPQAHQGGTSAIIETSLDVHDGGVLGHGQGPSP